MRMGNEVELILDLHRHRQRESRVVAAGGFHRCRRPHIPADGGRQVETHGSRRSTRATGTGLHKAAGSRNRRIAAAVRTVLEDDRALLRVSQTRESRHLDDEFKALPLGARTRRAKVKRRGGGGGPCCWQSYRFDRLAFTHNRMEWEVAVRRG
jgi:hypothetical protein